MRRLIVAAALLLAPIPALTQPATAPAPVAAIVTPPPATKLEAFKPTAGSVVTFGYNDLGEISGVSVDVRELSYARGVAVRGVLVQVTQSQYREASSFIDADELPELLRGIDALLAVKDNPTSFKNFEVRYTTKGECRITAFNSRGRMVYAVAAGRGVPASRTGLDEGDLRKLRGFFEAAQTTLAGMSAPR